MKATTIKVTVETRQRLRRLGGTTHEGRVVEALEKDRFWAEVEAASAWRRGLPQSDRAARAEAEAAVDRAFRNAR